MSISNVTSTTATSAASATSAANASQNVAPQEPGLFEEQAITSEVDTEVLKASDVD